MTDPKREPAEASAPRAVLQSKASGPGPHALWQLGLARWRSFYREPSALFWSFGFPVLLSMALGIAFRNRPAEPLGIAIEPGPGAEQTLRALSHRPELTGVVVSAEQASRALRSGKYALVVTPGTPRVYQYDPARIESRLARELVDEALQRADGRLDVLKTDDVLVTEPGARYIDFLIPGLLGMGLMTSGMWGVSYVIVEMRAQKLVKRLVATPMRKRDFLLSFVLVRALFLLFEMPVLVGFGYLVFSVPLRGPIWLLGATGVWGSLVFAGLGLLLASRAKNVQTVGGLINLVTLPMYICSGVFFSSDRFPEPMQPLIRALPLTALNDALRAIMLDGAGMLAIGPQLLTLTVWGVLCFVGALWLFRWR